MPAMTDLEFGQALAQAIARKGWTNKEFARRMPVDPTLVSKWIHGPKQMTRYQIQRAVSVLDDFAFCVAAARYVVGGVLGTTLDAVDGRLAGATLCVGKELREMAAALEMAHDIVVTPPHEHERDQALEVTLNLLELVTACKELAVRMCQDYRFPASLIAALLTARLYEQGYTTRNGRFAGTAVAA